MEKSEKNKALTKKERQLLRRQQRGEKSLRHRRQKKVKNFLLIAVTVLIVVGGVFGVGLFLATRPSPSEAEIIPGQGIHWHTELSITILGQKQVIPDNVGSGIIHQPIHTHEEDNIIHLEFDGSVRKDDIRLGRFFEIWNRQFNQDCIFTSCNGAEGTVKMFVNGEPNFEFENYAMRDEDKIAIIFE